MSDIASTPPIFAQPPNTQVPSPPANLTWAVTGPTKSPSRSRAQERALALRAEYWPDAATVVWDRKAFKGFTSIPRTLTYVMLAMDSLCKNAPPSSTYFVLWCRAFEEHVLVIDNPAVLAAESGFGGQRATTTWNGRMKSLVELGFIEARKGTTGDYHTVLLKNPNKVMQGLRPKLQPLLYDQFFERALEIGAKDVIPVPAPPTAT